MAHDDEASSVIAIMLYQEMFMVRSGFNGERKKKKNTTG